MYLCWLVGSLMRFGGTGAYGFTGHSACLGCSYRCGVRLRPRSQKTRLRYGVHALDLVMVYLVPAAGYQWPLSLKNVLRRRYGRQTTSSGIVVVFVTSTLESRAEQVVQQSEQAEMWDAYSRDGSLPLLVFVYFTFHSEHAARVLTRRSALSTSVHTRSTVQEQTELSGRAYFGATSPP